MGPIFAGLFRLFPQLLAADNRGVTRLKPDTSVHRPFGRQTRAIDVLPVTLL